MVDQPVLDVLSNPATYGVDSVDVIKTATAMVFLTGGAAYKIPRPVNLSFLDLSTREKRIDHLQREFEMNKAMSPHLYQELLKIVDGTGIVPLSHPGEARELVYRMKQMDPQSTMDNCLKNGTVTDQQMIQIAHVVSDFHTNASVESEYGTPEKIKFGWDELFSHVAGGREGFISPDDFTFVKQTVEGFMTKNAALLQARVEDQKIRFCHGDLHAGNIFLDNGVTLFDRISFNKRFPCCDVMSEVAFLTMDLEFHGKKSLASTFVNQYIKNTGDTKGLAVLTFYKCFRAWIRGCINYFEKNPESKKYFDLAVRYAKEM